MSRTLLKLGSVLILGSVLFACSSCNMLLPTQVARLTPPVVKATEVTWNTQKVERGDIIVGANDSGQIISLENKELSFAYAGEVAPINYAEGDVVKKGQLLAEMKGDKTLTYQFELAKVDLKRLKITLAQLKSQKADKYSIDFAQNDVEKKQVEIANLQKQINGSRIYSPIDGVITYVAPPKEPDENGDKKTPAGDTIIKVADSSQPMLQYLGTLDKGNLKVGMKVKITGQDGNAYSGTGTVYKVPLLTDDSSQILIKFDNYDDSLLKINDIVDVSVTIQQAKNVIRIPLSLVTSYQDRDYVFVLKDKKIKVERTVIKGITDGTMVEIKSGLSVGEEVITDTN